MMKFRTAIAAAAVISAALATAAAAASNTSPAPASGPDLLKELGAGDYRTYCAACHGAGGKGDGTVAEFLTIAAADLTQLTKKNAGIFPRERITAVIDGRAEVKVHGPRDMPVWGDWFNREAIGPDMDKDAREAVVSARITGLVAYIESLQE
jgi:mono/diheme cytochrome c family protein